MHKITSGFAALGALILLAVPAAGAIIHPTHPVFGPHGLLIFRPLLPVPEPTAWSLVALGTILFLLLRTRTLSIWEQSPPTPARLARTGGWELLASSHTDSPRGR